MARLSVALQRIWSVTVRPPSTTADGHGEPDPGRGVDQRRGKFVDPRLAQTRFGDWAREWVQAHDVSAVTWATYDSHLRNHILPRFADTELGDMTRMTVKVWAKQLRRKLRERSVGDVVDLLSRIMGEAVDEELIGSNPCRKLRLATGGGY